MPGFVYYILLFIVAIVGSYFLWFRLMSIWSRDNMNYQEYEWPFYPGELTKSSTISGDPWAGENIGGCLDQECCAPGTIFDASINQCVIPSTTTTSTSTTTTTASPYGSITPSLSSSSSNFVTNTATSIYNDSVNAVNTGVSDVTSGVSSLYGDASTALSGVETFVNNATINEALTKHSRKYTKPVATLGSYVPTAKFSDSFINY